jgi:hypothetical protein
VRLDHFTTAASDRKVTTSASSSHPHLVSYGSGRMLLACGAGAGMTAQVYDAASGQAVGGRSSAIQIARVMPS